MILHGDCLERMREMADNSIDSVVTDPPYGLSFMGKKWDYDVPSVAIWREVFRVLRPGGHILCFGGARTYHRMVVSVEDAGFEIRDQIQWIYGSGFPKSTNVGLRIDKEAGLIGARSKGFNTAGGKENFDKQDKGFRSDYGHVTEYTSDDAKKWQGFGTALKPAHEPICLARKPLEHSHTIAANVLKHGTGALNIDASRIATDGKIQKRPPPSGCPTPGNHNNDGPTVDRWRDEKGWDKPWESSPQGRWPANLILGCACEGDIHDEGCAVGMLDAQSGESDARGGRPKDKSEIAGNINISATGGPKVVRNDTGGASRFFYVAKASKRERNAGLDGMPEKRIKAYEGGDIASAKTPDSPGGKRTAQNHHPCVKPIRLMEYLIRLITPHGGRVLDPFAGSGSTGVACKRLGFEFIGIELDEAYAEIAVKRIEACI